VRAWYEKRDGGRNPPSFDLLVFQLFFVIVTFMVVTLVIIPMVAGAGILEIITARAVFEIEVETDGFIFGILGWLDAQDGRNIFSFRKFFV